VRSRADQDQAEAEVPRYKNVCHLLRRNEERDIPIEKKDPPIYYGGLEERSVSRSRGVCDL
jgi:hypothetical protein